MTVDEKQQEQNNKATLRLAQMWMDLEECHFSLTHQKEDTEARGREYLDQKQIAERIQSVMDVLYHAAHCEQEPDEYCQRCNPVVSTQ